MTSSWMTCASLLLALTAFATGCDEEVIGGAGGGDGEGGGAAEGGGDGEGGDAPDPSACTQEGSFQACFLPGDDAGSPSGGQECWMNDDGSLSWTACEDASSAMSTPLVLVFDDAPVSFSSAPGHFDLSGIASVATDWPAAATPWLALDRDGDGAIGSGAELFGSAVTLGSGRLADNGFQALAELDSNGDGRISPDDARWSSLRLWADADQDRASSAGELEGLAARGVVSIDLAYHAAARCDARGNCEIERATFRFVGPDGEPREGAVVDVHLRHR